MSQQKPRQSVPPDPARELQQAREEEQDFVDSVTLPEDRAPVGKESPKATHEVIQEEAGRRKTRRRR